MEQVCVNCNKPKEAHRLRERGEVKKYYCSASDRTAGKFDPGQPPTQSIKVPVPAPVKEVSRETADDVTPVRRARRKRT